MKPSFWLAIVCLVGLYSTGCALTQGHANIEYTPQGGESVAKVADVQSPPVQVTVVDQRASKGTVGHKTNGYGMEMADITSDNDVAQTLQSAIVTELKNRGFTIGEGQTVTATLSKFENRFVNGFWSGTATGELVMNVVVTRADHGIVYTKLIDAQGVNPGIQIASGENAEIALNRTLQGAVTQLLEDPAFLASLRSPGKTEAANPNAIKNVREEP